MIVVVVDRLSLRWVPDALAEPLIPAFRSRPQGGGTAPLEARAVFTAIVNGACVRAKKGGYDRPSPVDRGKPGSKIHALSDRAGLPLAIAISAANANDSSALEPLVMAVPAIRSRRGPRRRKPAKLRADKAYDQPDLRRWVRDITYVGLYRVLSSCGRPLGLFSGSPDTQSMGSLPMEIFRISRPSFMDNVTARRSRAQRLAGESRRSRT
jgi:hypothetical protein